MSLEERLGLDSDQFAALPELQTPWPCPVWTGKGGSVGTGTMALSPADADLARWGDAAKLVDRWMQRADINLPPRIIVNYEILEANLRANLIAAIGAFPGLSQARSLMLLLSLQHQRRHQVLQREDIDRHRVELQLPLSSPQVARAALTLSIEDLSEGTVFRLLLERHYPEVMATPWRSSPGQLPCPLPIPSPVKGRMRWFKQDPRRRATLRRAWQLAREWPVPPGVLRRTGFVITLALTAAHVREGIYSLRRAEAFARWLHR
jgi:asparagine synthase (glutamine-hydrolysing)